MHEAYVFVQAGLPVEYGLTLVAIESVLTGVVEHVRAKLGRLDELFPANGALMWSFT